MSAGGVEALPASREITSEQAAALQAIYAGAGETLFWIIHQHPTKPGKYRAQAGRLAAEHPLGVHLIGATRDAVRALLPPGLTQRGASVSPVIMEVWA